ncbi:MAG: FkbM family methyltransferase [Acidobacteriota bacterium]
MHRALRATAALWPFPFGDAWVSGWLARRFAPPTWLRSDARGQWPSMVLDVSHRLQCKFFMFPRLHGWYMSRLPFRRFLEQTLAPGATFIDVGSNIGFFSLLAARLVGAQGRVYAFEPEPALHGALVRSARLNALAHLEPFQVALSDHEDDATFFRAKDGTASSLVPEAPGREGRYEAAVRIPVTTLDRIVGDGRVDVRALRVIKIDVEGEEARAIRGMRETLVQAGYPAIWCEVRGPQGSTRAPNTFGPARDQLATLGYRAYLWNRGALVAADERNVRKRVDVLFMR